MERSLGVSSPDSFLRVQRRSRALTVDALAAELGVHPNTILRWERRERLPGPGHIRGLARCLAVEPAQVTRFFDAARPPAPEGPRGVRGVGLRPLREAAKVPAAALAAAAEVPTANIYNWEAGRARIPAHHLATLAELLGVEQQRLRRLLSAAPAAHVSPVHPLRRLRRRTGLSQAQVAGRIGASRHTVGAWERGRRPPPGMLRPLATVYGVPLETVARATRTTPPELLDRRRWSAGDLPAVLDTLRRWSGLTQAELAERCGCSVSAVRSWESGRTVPSDRLRRRLEATFGLPTHALLRAFPPQD